jgi:hypothetical protein
MADFARIRAEIRDAARAAWSALRAERPAERFYYYGLWTSPLAHRPAPTACSAEGLRRAADAYRADGLTVDEDELRWAVNESPYDLYGDDHFARLEPLFDALGGPYDRPRAVNEELLEAMIGALGDLDAEGFFGTGAEREALVINVTMPGHEHPREAVETARRLNPGAALARYEAGLSAAEPD